jgi:hypothetical protein
MAVSQRGASLLLVGYEDALRSELARPAVARRVDVQVHHPFADRVAAEIQVAQ